jgi:hypothetical protein
MPSGKSSFNASIICCLGRISDSPTATPLGNSNESSSLARGAISPPCAAFFYWGCPAFFAMSISCPIVKPDVAIAAANSANLAFFNSTCNSCLRLLAVAIFALYNAIVASISATRSSRVLFGALFLVVRVGVGAATCSTIIGSAIIGLAISGLATFGFVFFGPEPLIPRGIRVFLSVFSKVYSEIILMSSVIARIVRFSMHFQCMFAMAASIQLFVTALGWNLRLQSSS